MDASQPARPILLRKTRRHGRHDYDRFDHLTSSSVCVGYGSIGKVKVNCRFLFAESQWGVLGQASNPAGIIYMDLDFDQPPDCRLRSATVLVTLREIPLSPRYGPSEGVRLTDNYGPKHIRGERSDMHVKESLHLRPEIQALGCGGGGVGIERERTKLVAGRWMFTGQLVPGKGRHWAYETVKWELAENAIESQAFHASVIHTGFAFEHNGTQFHMTVKVKGALTSLGDQLWNKMRCGKDNDEVTTLVRFQGRYAFQRPLDELARGLQWAMESRNMCEVPVEIPDSIPVSFGQVAPEPLGQRPANNPSATQAIAPSQTRPLQQTLQRPPGRPELQLRPRDGEVSPPWASTHDPDGLLQDIARAAGLAVPPGEPTQESVPENTGRSRTAMSLSSSSSSTTAVDREAETETVNVVGPETAGLKAADGKPLLLWLLELPFIVVLVQLFSSVVAYKPLLLSKGAEDPAVTQTPAKDQNSDPVVVPGSQAGSRRALGHGIGSSERIIPRLQSRTCVGTQRASAHVAEMEGSMSF